MSSHKQTFVRAASILSRAARGILVGLVAVTGGLAADAVSAEPVGENPPAAEAGMRQLLDAPLLFTKRHSYSGIHIYDTFYKWPPGGGGIYVIENPADPRPQWRIHPIIDPTTPETLGLGVYTDPELFWDATKLLFCFKGEPHGSTSIYEIGVDGHGLRRLTDPEPTCDDYHGSHAGQHDVMPAYLSDGWIVFLSSRPSGLVPCNNTGVAILHVMQPDGSDIHPISVNNVNEFDPAPLPDGRLLFGRWEYIDKNALTIQSLWAVNPDGTQETAVFANNMVFPEAVLDARPVPGSSLIVATFAKHNGTPRGSIAMIDPRRGKNNPQAIVNLEHPEQPTFDRGDSCEPWPLSEEVVLFSGRPSGYKRNVLEMIDRAGHRFVLHSDPEICLHSPMLIKPRTRPPVICDVTDRQARTGRFFLQDVYKGLTGVKRGEVKWLRVLEETSRTSATSGGTQPYNQTFLVSSALAFSVKNFLGMVPVEEDGSAYFEVPAGRAVYLQALDAQGRLVQSMRSFVQAAPGTTRSCIGCHEHKYSTTAAVGRMSSVMGREPSQLQGESWGSGYLDYPSMIQPVLDQHCVDCHGGEQGIAAAMDLSGGWTEHFNISYENLTNRCETQLVAYWISGIDCMNGTALWSAQIFPPRSHGSGSAPLAELLIGGHEGRLAELTRPQRDLLMAWIDTNGLYHGTWNTTPNGCAIRGWAKMRADLTSQMQAAGCVRCHGDASGRVLRFENDWVNLQEPELSRILRAPLAEGDTISGKSGGFGLDWCRRRKVDPNRQRIHLLWKGYAHAVQKTEAFERHELVEADRSGESVVSFASTADPHYQAMLTIIRGAREQALASPRVDMPGAEVTAGACRLFVMPSAAEVPAALEAGTDRQGVVHLTWKSSAQTIGLEAELHRCSEKGFTPDASTLLTRTSLSRYVDRDVAAGQQHYALVLLSDGGRSRPAYATVDVPPPPAVAAPSNLTATALSSTVRLRWQAPDASVLGYHVYRAAADSEAFAKLTAEPIRQTRYSDTSVVNDTPYRYVVRAVSQRRAESRPTPPVQAMARWIKEPIFASVFEGDAYGQFYGDPATSGTRHGNATAANGVLDLRRGGHVTFPQNECFTLAQPISLEFWVRFEQPGSSPVMVSCGLWNQSGWFLQRLGNTWRWHVGGLDCDGGRPAQGRWIHLAAIYDGQALQLYEDGKLVAQRTGDINTAPWSGEMHVGQYSGGLGPQYQVTGQIRGVKVYHRALEPSEIGEAALAR